uniref:Sushi, von Willebrand factor type A, EGF and pentraxin domain-containing protein 1-like n=1 Tax=Phallusia mammillata TaxID=59560 RepID=A0A6F9DUN0_9ASCI|nr:sushi, von Willebrand factor type A, EGF and pentraxin domain-containing protein 1-like [Phallusia mammillata]
MKRHLALLLFLINIWRVSTVRVCPEINNFEDGSMFKYLGELGVEEIRFQCSPNNYLSGPREIRCVNGSWSADPPVCQNVSRCSFIPQPEHGSFKREYIAKNGNMEVEFQCDEGYILDNRYDAAIRCDASMGFWSGPVPSCKLMTPCIPLSEPIHGSVNLKEGSMWEDPHAVIQFDCDDGYYRVGPESLTCNGTGFWNQMPPTCHEIIPCEAVSAPTNGHVVQLQSRDAGSHRVMFYCDEGYMMQGVDYNRCEKGVWLNEMPTCVVQANCPVPQPDPSVRMLPISKTYEDRSIISFICIKSAQIMSGSKRMYCKGGKWQGKMPVCNDRLCTQLTPPLFGSITTTDKSGFVKPGTVTTFACNEGLTFYGTTKRTCSVWGSYTYSRWSVCAYNVSCPNISNANASVKSARWSPVPYPEVLSTAQVKCNPGFNPTYNQYLTCEPGGKWSRQPRTCIERPKCPVHPPIMNGTLSATQTHVGQGIQVVCDDGYVLAGSSHIACRQRGKFGYWSLSPSCRKIPEVTESPELPELPSLETVVVPATGLNFVPPALPPLGGFAPPNLPLSPPE